MSAPRAGEAGRSPLKPDPGRRRVGHQRVCVVVLPPDVLARVDAVARRCSTTARAWTRADALRALIAAGLAQVERAEGVGRGGYRGRRSR